MLELFLTTENFFNTETEDIDTMRVLMLREKLEDHGLELDGTINMLVARLKEASCICGPRPRRRRTPRPQRPIPDIPIQELLR